MNQTSQRFVLPEKSLWRSKRLEALDDLEKTMIAPKKVFKPTESFIQTLNRNWMFGYPDNLAFVAHKRTDPDEVVGLVEIVLSKRGQELFPGASFKTPILYTTCPDDYNDHCGGKLFLGVGIGINEHKLPLEFQETECCATFTAKVLGIENDPTFVPIIKAAAIDDLHASSARNSLAQFMKRAYRLGEETPSVVAWTIDRVIQWHEALKVGKEITTEEIRSFPDLAYYQNTVRKLLDTDANSRFYPLARALDPALKESLAADSLLAMVVRAYWFDESPNRVKEWFDFRMQQWHEDLMNSSPEVLQPEMDLAVVTQNICIEKRSLPLAVIYSERLNNQKYVEYMAKFARREQGCNAALVIQRNDAGNTQIFPNKRRNRIVLRDVAQFAMNYDKKSEQDRWYYPYFGILLNGSLKHTRPPTKLAVTDLVDVIEKYAWLKAA